MCLSRLNTPISKLVINDIGPTVPQSELDRIGGYVGNDLSFTSLDELFAYAKYVNHVSLSNLFQEKFIPRSDLTTNNTSLWRLLAPKKSKEKTVKKNSNLSMTKGFRFHLKKQYGSLKNYC